MLWYKNWLETRGRLLAIWLPVFLGFALAIALAIRSAAWLVPAPGAPHGGALVAGPGDRAAELANWWAFWFGGTLPFLLAALGLILAPGGLVSESALGSVSFSLSLPASRRRQFSVRAALLLLELLATALWTTLLAAGLGELLGHPAPWSVALVQALLTALGVAVLLSLGFLLAALFNDWAKPLALGLGLFLGGSLLVNLMASFTEVGQRLGRFGIAALRATYEFLFNDSFFIAGHFPWRHALACVALTLILLELAIRVTERRDY